MKPITLPPPGMWADPALLTCDVARPSPAPATCPDDAAIVRLATNFLVRAYGRRWSAGFERIVERPDTAVTCREDASVVLLGGARPWPIIAVESVKVNGVDVAPNLWSLDLNRIAIHPDPFSASLWAWWPTITTDYMRIAAEPKLVPIDVVVGTATTMVVSETVPGTWSIQLTGLGPALPACDTIVLATTDGYEFELPRDHITGAGPWTYTGADIAMSPTWLQTVADYKQNAQAWLLYHWRGADGWPTLPTPADTTVTVKARTYVANPLWRGRTMEITYFAGVIPPSADVIALRLACELRNLMCSTDPAEADKRCGLPKGSQLRSLSRQGLSMQFDDAQIREAILGWDPIVDQAIRDNPVSAPVEVWAPSRADRGYVRKSRGW